jgi:hypothetical protein
MQPPPGKPPLGTPPLSPPPSWDWRRAVVVLVRPGQAGASSGTDRKR